MDDVFDDEADCELALHGREYDRINASIEQVSLFSANGYFEMFYAMF